MLSSRCDWIDDAKGILRLLLSYVIYRFIVRGGLTDMKWNQKYLYMRDLFD